MKKSIGFRRLALSFCAALTLACSACSQKEAAETLKKAEEAAEETAQTVANDAERLMEKGEEIGIEIGEKAVQYLAPLREKFGTLESLKETPGELKKRVAELIQTIENKAEDIKLPESASNALTSVKEKLVALRDYLEGEVEQAKIEEHLQGIMDSVKSGLGMSDKQ